MTEGSHAERIIRLLAETPRLDDDEIAHALAIEPRQTVNQVCRRLAGRGVLSRERGPGGKIVNRLGAGAAAVSARRTGKPRTAGSAQPATVRGSGRSLAPADLAATLLILPCAGAKQDRTGIGEAGALITQSLPPDLAGELLDARRRVAGRIPVNEATLVPAWKRYDGSLYRAGREALRELMEAGAHIVILSGGYGAVLASEPIGLYDTVLKPSCWPGRLLERVLVAYARRHSLSSARAFCSASGPYRRVLQRVRWRDAWIDDALLLVPQAESGGMVKSPTSQGEALAALRDGSLTTGWRSSYVLSLEVHPA